MANKIKKGTQDDSFAIHQYYMDIINCMPNIVYWIDNNCLLKGCNKHFVELLGLKRVNDFSGTPYEPMSHFSGGSNERIEALRLDDLKVLFSGEPTYDVEEPPIYNKKGKALYYHSTRVPLFDKNKQVVGLVVVLTDVTDRKKIEAQEVDTPIQMKGKDAIEHLNEPNVLMVEDNFIAQRVEEALLTTLHCHVDIAESGEKALKLFNPGKYDIVFMDIGLEDTSGYMVAKKFRQMEKDTTYHVPIIALTSYQANAVKDDCNDYFMDGVLTKPLTSEQAQQIIKHFVYHENVPVGGLISMK